MVDPRFRVGRPTVEGVGTERLGELSDAGRTFADIAAGCDIAGAHVQAAIAYEEQQRTP